MKRVALIVIDYQNDFVHPDGALYVAGAEKLIDKMLAVASLPYDTVVLTKDWHPTNDISFRAQGGQWPAHCVINSWGAKIYSPFKPSKVDMILHKTGYSAFSYANGRTGLQGYLDDLNVNRVDIIGVALDFCVRHTAIDAERAGFTTTVLLGCTAAVTTEGQAETLHIAKELGVRFA
jgi:nicotinamidase/pyrazinamidase